MLPVGHVLLEQTVQAEPIKGVSYMIRVHTLEKCSMSP